MTLWINTVTISMPRSGTTTFAVDPNTSGTVVSGARFVPTSGRLLVAVATAAVTFTLPSGWTLPGTGSAVNQAGLYVWYKIAAGSDTLTTTGGASNFPAVFTFMEFGTGSTFIASAAAVGQNKAAGAGPTLSGLPATAKLIIGAAGHDYTATTGTAAYGTWGGSAIEYVDTFLVKATTDGYAFGLAYIEDTTATSQAIATTLTASASTTTNVERLVFAITAVAEATVSVMPDLVMAPIRR